MLRVIIVMGLLPFVLIIGLVIMIAAMADGARTQAMAACGRALGQPAANPSDSVAQGLGAAGEEEDPNVPLVPDGLSPVRIAELALAVGFTGEEVPMAVAIALAESRGRPAIDNAGLNEDGSVDYGLWQINDDAHGPKGFDPARARDPIYNAVWARRVYTDAGGSWSPWMVYRRETYRQHLAVATAAAGIAAPRPEDQAAAAALGTGGTPPSAAGAGCTGPTQLINSGFPAEIEGYQPRDPQDTCDMADKPGVVDFKDLLLASYPRVFWGIGRDCGDGGPSEHKEGRALDWGVNVNIPEQRAAAEDVIGKLLATDEHGNAHALFRRLGLMYIIWDRQIISSSRINEGWRSYSCDGTPGDCHTNHIHFSFSWAGALRQTSWWTVGSDARLLGQDPPPEDARAAPAQAADQRDMR